MKCGLCEKNAVFGNPAYCKEHFCGYIEKKVLGTIEKYNLIEKGQKVAVAASGGKDSLSVLYILNKYGYGVTALAIDEGISGYRDRTLATLKKICGAHKIKLRIVSFKGKFSKSLDEILFTNRERPCTVCGVFRRYLLNLHARDYDVLATGHNMDDEAQVTLMNLIKNNLSAMQRMGPSAGVVSSEKFTRRVKPLYFCTEKEIMTYAFINKLTADFNECPNVSRAFRLRVRDMLNEIEQEVPGAKKNLIEWSLKSKTGMKTGEEGLRECRACGELSSADVCMACRYMEKISV
ncbi:hypothetical protein QT06_C0001G0587 [archaeon GW2011_AR15]|nr:hypothetical protein QT06_C0001G0587 [archaeon GW2011_AR15]MBS3103898.1 TIGR00269 family protein [Candidatus Woesearchaeota archaeon]